MSKTSERARREASEPAKIAYVNGEYLPHAQASISIDDRVLMYGDAVFDTTRTFDGRPFRLEEHLARLCRSLRYVEMDGEKIVGEVREACAGVVERNAAYIRKRGDVWLTMIVTRGPVADPDDPRYRPTVLVKLREMDFARFGPLYSRGVDLRASLLTDHFSGAVDPRVKAANRLGLVRAELKGLRAAKDGGGGWSIVCNSDGSLSETHAANLCLISQGRLMRPTSSSALEGVSVLATAEIAASLGMEVRDARLTLYDLLNAEEVLITASSFCILPVRSVDGIGLRTDWVSYRAILDGWRKLTGLDFVQQALEHGQN